MVPICRSLTIVGSFHSSCYIIYLLSMECLLSSTFIFVLRAWPMMTCSTFHSMSNVTIFFMQRNICCELSCMWSTPRTLASTNETCGYFRVSYNGMELSLNLQSYNVQWYIMWSHCMYVSNCRPKVCVFWHGGCGFKTKGMSPLML